jgi:hypothetical protein
MAGSIRPAARTHEAGRDVTSEWSVVSCGPPEQTWLRPTKASIQTTDHSNVGLAPSDELTDADYDVGKALLPCAGRRGRAEKDVAGSLPEAEASGRRSCGISCACFSRGRSSP